ncbi:unnamed protein product, partial [Didymodactylos carnosus]
TLRQVLKNDQQIRLFDKLNDLGSYYAAEAAREDSLRNYPSKSELCDGKIDFHQNISDAATESVQVKKRKK